MAIHSYLRVSTAGQAESGAGLDAQYSSCVAYAERQGEQLAGCYRDEGVSGAYGLDKRPALLTAIENLKKGDVLLVAKRDRLGRDPIHVAMIERAVDRKGARIVSAAGEGTEADDPASVLMRRMIDAFAEYERLVIKARTKAALRAIKERGERVGHIPFGYQTEGRRLVECDQEQRVLSEINILRAEGLSLRQIANELNTRGILNRGNRWNHVSVKRVARL
jgi:site-specific DNA recombinase